MRSAHSDFDGYFRSFQAPKPLTVAQTFATRAAADAWLASGNAKDGDLVKRAGQGFVVLNALKGLKFVPMNLLAGSAP